MQIDLVKLRELIDAFEARIDHQDPVDTLTWAEPAAALCGLRPYGIHRLPRDPNDVDGYVEHENMWHHRSVPAATYKAIEKGARENGGPSVLMQQAWRNRGGFTMHECERRHPGAADRWVFDLHRASGMMDCFLTLVPFWAEPGFADESFMVKFHSTRLLVLNPKVCVELERLSKLIAMAIKPFAKPRRRREHRAHLSPKQMREMQLACSGFTDEEIAKRLGSTTAAVNKSLQRARQQLGAKTIEQAAARFHRLHPGMAG
jgi:DNA-binding CsgD family transcriptional regulator